MDDVLADYAAYSPYTPIYSAVTVGGVQITPTRLFYAMVTR